MDWSTIDLDALRQLPVYKGGVNYDLQEGSGNGCAGDPPGYPSYFTSCVYRNGNPPRHGPHQVIVYDGVWYTTDPGDTKIVVPEMDVLLRSLWKPLPIDHERTRLWIKNKYRHHQHCYYDAERPEYGRPGTLVYPLSHYDLINKGAYLLQQKMVQTPEGFKPKYSEEYLYSENRARQILIDQEQARAKRIAVPDNHQAVVLIRKFYPEYQPELDLIAHPPTEIVMWWETEAEQPSEADCARTQRWDHRHPMGGTWCQWCGRRYDQAQTKE